GSHYSLQSAKSYQAWFDATPPDFVFSVKGSRYLTHMLRFRGDEVTAALANFFASGLFNLREKLSVILWQFPPSYRYRAEAFADFLQRLPHDTHAAAKLARQHDARVKSPCMTPDKNRPLRHAIEIR